MLRTFNFRESEMLTINTRTSFSINNLLILDKGINLSLKDSSLFYVSFVGKQKPTQCYLLILSLSLSIDIDIYIYIYIYIYI